MKDGAEPLTSASLLRQIRDYRNDEAWQTFFGRYKPLIEGWCRRHGLRSSEVDEVTSTVLHSLARTMKTFEYDPQKGGFRPWLYQTVHNAVASFWRGRQRRPGDWGSGDSDVHDALANLVEELDTCLEYQTKLLEKALEVVQRRVSPETWRAFYLTAIDGLPGEQAAREVGRSIAAVHQAKYRVMKMLEEEVAGLQGPEAGSP